MVKFSEIDVVQNVLAGMSDDFYYATLAPLYNRPAEDFDMDALKTACEQMASGTYAYEGIRGGKKVMLMGSDQTEGGVLESFKMRVIKKNDGKKVVDAPVLKGDVSSIYTSLYNVLRDTPVNDRVMPLNEGLKALVSVLNLTTAEEIAKVCSYIVSATGTVKGKLGSLDESVVMDKDEAKARLSRMVVKNKTYVTTPLLFTKLLQFKFGLSGVYNKPSGEKDDQGNVVHPRHIPLTLDTLKNGHGYIVNVTLEDVTLCFELYVGKINVKGDVEAFFLVWNMHLQDEEMIYVPIEPEFKICYDYLLALYDVTYDDKTRLWSMKRNEMVIKDVSADEEDYKKISKWNASICKFLSDLPVVPRHYNDKYNMYLFACDRSIGNDPTFVDAVNKIAINARNTAMLLSGKGRAIYGNIMKGTTNLTEAVKVMNQCRQERGKYRNIGAREAITKNLMDPIYPLHPSPLVTARKFMSIMISNPMLYAADCDVYGCANMHFYDAIASNHGLVYDREGNQIKCGKRDFYDNDQRYLGNNIADVKFGDFYAIGKDVGIGKGIIDDVQSGYPKLVQEMIGESMVSFPSGCMSHKMRIIHNAKYDMGCIKMMANKIKNLELKDLSNRGWLYALGFYKRVVFDVPGKFQSGEFFIYFSDRQGAPSQERMDALYKQDRKSVV